MQRSMNMRFVVKQRILLMQSRQQDPYEDSMGLAVVVAIVQGSGFRVEEEGNDTRWE